jgi:hypothetical protein
MNVSDFSFPGEITLKKGNLVTTLPYIGKEYRISFELLLSRHGLSEVTRDVITFAVGGILEDRVIYIRIPAKKDTSNTKVNPCMSKHGQTPLCLRRKQRMNKRKNIRRVR